MNWFEDVWPVILLIFLFVTMGIFIGDWIGENSIKNSACEYIANNDIKAMRTCQDKPPWEK